MNSELFCQRRCVFVCGEFLSQHLPYKIHKFANTRSGIVIYFTLMYSILRTIMKVFGKRSNFFPSRIWEIVMAIYSPIDLPSLPVI